MATDLMSQQLTKKRRAVADGVFKAELNNFLMKELAEDGIQVRRTLNRVEIIIMATRTQSVLGERGRRIRELTSVVQKRFGFSENSVEVVVSGKIRGQRAKAMKFVDGLMIHSGNPVANYVQQAVRHVNLRQGVLGIKVKIMLPHDPQGLMGPRFALPDHVQISKPQDEEIPLKAKSEHRQEEPPITPAAPVHQPAY